MAEGSLRTHGTRVLKHSKRKESGIRVPCGWTVADRRAVDSMDVRVMGGGDLLAWLLIVVMGSKVKCDCVSWQVAGI